MLHAGQKAAPRKSKKGGKKRKEALMQRGRFWAGLVSTRAVPSRTLSQRFDTAVI